MTLPERQDSSLPSSDGKVVPYRRSLRYPTSPEVQLPTRPETEIRSDGFLGLGTNPDDRAHDRRVTRIYYLGAAVSYAEAMALGTDFQGLKHAAEAMAKAEEIVNDTRQGSVAGLLADDLGADMAARARIRHGRFMDTFDAEAFNLLRGR